MFELLTRRQKLMLGVFVASLAASIACLAYPFLVPSPLDVEIARIKAKGEPTTSIELDCGNLNELENHEVWAAAHNVWSAITGPKYSPLTRRGTIWLYRDPSGPWPEVASARSLLSENLDSLSRIQCVLRKLTPEPAESRPASWLDVFSNAETLLGLETRIAIRDGELDRSLNGIHDLLRYAQLASNAKSSTERPQCLWHVMSVIDPVLNSRLEPRHEKILRTIQTRLAMIDVRGEFLQRQLANRAHKIEDCVNGSDPRISKITGPYGIVTRASHHPLMVSRVISLSRIIDATRDGWLPVIQLAQQIEVDDSVVCDRLWESPDDHSFGERLMWDAESSAESHCWRQIAGVAIAARRFQLRHGRWPQALSGIPEIEEQGLGVDPIDLRPIRYRVENDTAVVYGIGLDGKDDGGNLDPLAIAQRDMTLRLRAPSPISNVKESATP